MVDLELLLSLSTTPYLTLFIIILPLLFFYLFASSRILSSSSPTPCPDSYPLVGNLFALLKNRHRFHDWVSDMLSPKDSLSPLTIKVNCVLGISHGVCTVDHFVAKIIDLKPVVVYTFLMMELLIFLLNPFDKLGSRFYSVLEELLGHGIFNVDGEIWTIQRKIASHEFNTKSLKSFISNTVQSHLATRLIPLLSSASHDNKIVDLQDIFRKFTFDNICNVAFGTDPECLLSNNINLSLNASFVRAFDYAVEVNSDRFMSPLACYAFWFIGKDSTSTALTWFFWLIAGHPQCEELIYNELSTVATSSPSNSPNVYSYDELKNLHYLHASISESLRLFPPVPINSRLSLAKDILPDGTHVGKGWFADYSAYAMGRSERVWGPDCREFKPGRWLNSDGIFQPSDQFKFPVFHSGPRLCLGKEMAYVQMKSVAAALIYEFKVEAIDGGGRRENLKRPPYVLSLNLKMRGGLPVRLKRRQEFSKRV